MALLSTLAPVLHREVVASLNVLRLQMGQHLRSDNTVDTGSFKIVYVAPMKALVAEMVGNFSQRLKKFGMQVRRHCCMHIHGLKACPCKGALCLRASLVSK